MPAEVISLLSSPEPSAPQGNFPEQLQPQPQPHLQPTAAVLPPAISFPRHHNTASLSDPSARGKNTPAVATQFEVTFTSDDFEYVADLTGAHEDGLAGPLPKRQRLGPSSSSRPAGPTPFRPSWKHVTALAPEVIEISSSSPHPRLAARQPDAPEPPVSFVSDPFASPLPPASLIPVSRSPAGPKLAYTMTTTTAIAIATTTTTTTTISTSYNDDDDLFSSSQPSQEKPLRPPRHLEALKDDINDEPAASPPKAKQQPARPSGMQLSWDHISSSAPLPDHLEGSPRRPSARSLRRTRSAVVVIDDSDMSASDDDDELPDINQLASFPRRDVPVPRSKPVPKPPPKARAPMPRRTAEEKAREKEERTLAREEKARGKEAERERKQAERKRARHEKAQEKDRIQALAEANKVKTDKKKSVQEMILELPVSTDPILRLQIEKLCEEAKVQLEFLPSTDRVVRWRRKVQSRYDAEQRIWVPVPERIEREKQAMAIVTAAEFVSMVLERESVTLSSYVEELRQSFPGEALIFLIEGLDSWFRKNDGIRRRQFTAAARDDAAGPQAQSSHERPARGGRGRGRGGRRRVAPSAAPAEYVSRDVVEEGLLALQVEHGALIQHTATSADTAACIVNFTMHVSTVPYRRAADAERGAAAGFCMDAGGQARAGAGGDGDTYTRMLGEINRVTGAVAHGVAAEFPTVSRLVRALEDGGPLSLERVRKSANANGALTDRAVGAALSRRLHKIFTGRDEKSTDGIT